MMPESLGLYIDKELECLGYVTFQFDGNGCTKSGTAVDYSEYEPVSFL